MPSTGPPFASTAEAPSSLPPAVSDTIANRTTRPGPLSLFRLPIQVSDDHTIDGPIAAQPPIASTLRSPSSAKSPSDVSRSDVDLAWRQELSRSGSGGGTNGSGTGYMKVPMKHQLGMQEMEATRGLGGREGESVTPTQTPSDKKCHTVVSSKTTSQPAVGNATLSESQIHLIKYRERLACDLTARSVRLRVSPIQEELKRSPSPTRSSVTLPDATASSTELGKTIHAPPMGTTFSPAATRSYPLRRMGTTAQASAAVSNPVPSPSPAVFSASRSAFDGLSTRDGMFCGNSTTGSKMTFQPEGVSQPLEDDSYPPPNLYDLSLMLSAEPGLEAWWTTVVHIMTEFYRAERVSLAVPADPTASENVPWGQRATYNAHQDDHLTKGGDHVPTGSSDSFLEAFRTPAAENSHPGNLSRPGLQARHSFTRFEEEKGRIAAGRPHQAQRSLHLVRSKSYIPPANPKEEDRNAHVTNCNEASLSKHDAADAQRELRSEGSDVPRGNRPKVYAVLQALGREADALIDSPGVNRVIEQGKVVTLTRSYPYLAKGLRDDFEKQKLALRLEEVRRFKKPRADSSSSKLSCILSNAASLKGRRSSIDQSIADDSAHPDNQAFEEYEQLPPSPWTQSPAPSPAVRPDPAENPFFQDATVDKESFNPAGTPEVYRGMQPPEAIGMDNSWSVLHIPLPHLILSKRTQGGVFEMGSAGPSSRQNSRSPSGLTPSSRPPSFGPPEGDARMIPIAILSIQSPLIPYPANLRESLERLAPHLATSFSLSRRHSMLELQIARLHRETADILGFEVLDSDSHPHVRPENVGRPSLLQEESLVSQRCLGNITSPSEYSALVIGSTASPGISPGLETASLGQVLEKGMASLSPSLMMPDGYFGPNGATGKKLVGLDASQVTPKTGIADNSGKWHLRAPVLKTSLQEPSRSQPTASESALPADIKQREELSGRGTIHTEIPAITDPKISTASDGASDDEAHPHFSNAHKCQKKPGTFRKQQNQPHSCGADFYISGQNLPPEPTPNIKTSKEPGLPPCSGSGPLRQSDVSYPSSFLRSIILDLLPLQIFVVKPQTGHIAWVNSKFLSYRGQNIGNLTSDPYGAIHPDDRPQYLEKWAQCVRAGTSLETDTLVRIRRFDGQYRLFAVHGVPIRDKGNVVHFLGSFVDVHKQYMAEVEAKAKADLEESEAKHRLLANLIPQMIFTATENEGLTFANEQWLSYTGQSFEDSLGLGFVDFVHPDDLARCRLPSSQSSGTSLSGSEPHFRANGSWSSLVHDQMAADLAELARKGVIKVSTDSSGRRSYTTEVRLRARNGEYRWHLIRCVEIDRVNFGKGISSYFGSATDINDHKLLEAKLKEAMESKSRFLSNMSHEIRTPLIGIRGMVSFLQDTALNEEQLDYTNTIDTSAKSLLLMINDILDVSKVDAGMMKLSFEWFHTRSLIEDVNELIWTMAVSKGLELNYLVEQDVPCWVKGDHVRIRQVLLNIIGNAIKFTSEGEVFSHCRICTDEQNSIAQDEIFLEFSIIDTGRGFSKEESELIFKPFSQIDGSSTRQHGGSGLGLVISRQLVELHGGHMSGMAKPGQGSTFTFTAKFKLPSESDYPDIALTRGRVPLGQSHSMFESGAAEKVSLTSSDPSTNLSSNSEEPASPQAALRSSIITLPSSKSGTRSPKTGRSSVFSDSADLARFGEAARASGQDLSQMQLEMAPGRSSPRTILTRPSVSQQFRPSIYSILIVSPQKYSRRAIRTHIEMTIPKHVASHITSLESLEAAQKLLVGEDPDFFTHVVLNCRADEEATGMLDAVMDSPSGANTTVLLLVDSKQRRIISKAMQYSKYEEMVLENRAILIPKPAKPFTFAVIFDPAKERDDLSTDDNRSRALRTAQSQKQTYLDAKRRMGNRGHKVLVVEDNLINQKVLLKYLLRIGLEVEVASDGVEGTGMVFSNDHDYYSIVLVCCILRSPCFLSSFSGFPPPVSSLLKDVPSHTALPV